MVFDGDANDQDLCSLADLLLGGSDDVDFPLKEKALYANWSMRDIWKVINEVYGGWTPQDSNVSGEDQVATDLLNDGTQFYPLASVGALAGVSYKDENGNYFKLKPITLEAIQESGYAEDEFMDTPSTPQYYRPVKNGVKIYPVWYTSKATVTDGLIAHIASQDISPFTPSTTDTAPGYDISAGHEAVSAGMAWRKAKVDTLDAAPGLAEDWYTALASIKTHYKNKFKQLPQRIRNGRGSSFVDGLVS